MSGFWPSIANIDVINYVILCWVTCGFMRLATLQYEMRLQKCIRMGITVFKFITWEGISLDIRSEMMFYGSIHTPPQN